MKKLTHLTLWRAASYSYAKERRVAWLSSMSPHVVSSVRAREAGLSVATLKITS